MTTTSTNGLPALHALELTIEPQGPARRRGEPVRCGVPWPRGVLRDADLLTMTDADGRPVTLQARALDLWPDGSVRWTLLDWRATLDGPNRYVVEAGGDDAPNWEVGPSVSVTAGVDGSLTVETGAATFLLSGGDGFPLRSVAIASRAAPLPLRLEFTAEDADGRRHGPLVNRLAVEDTGPVRATVAFEGRLVSPGLGPLADFSGRLHFVAGSATVRFSLTIANPRRAEHPGNCWDLGDAGSIHLKDASLTVVTGAKAGEVSVSCSPERGAAFDRFGTRFDLYQDSSGGENWRSTNHVNRLGTVPNTFRGYRLTGEGADRDGLRATPIVVVEHPGGRLSLAVREFWENFPKAVEMIDGVLVLRLFPGQYADTQELQGGERKTHEFAIAFDDDGVTEEPLAWCRDPLLARADKSWYCASGAVPHLTPRSDGLDEACSAYHGLVDAAIEGPDTFAKKREVIDEFGWRHFGDIYGDHEAVFHDKSTPLVSHYNNQYDALAGFAYQFLRTGDGRWWSMMDELARHVADIDIYHTAFDKSAYNGGMFWHTCHYIDAGTSNHRTYPGGRSGGGGPSGGQLYSTGLLLHSFLTGDPASREAAVGLGRYVIDADDGGKTPLRWLTTAPTGHITESDDSTYHGPGRASANSVTTLINAHVATGSAEFLEKAEVLIRRCIHPGDRIEDRNLLDAERRWFYTMFLQALGRYLDHKADLGHRDTMYAYARAALLHYARWMAEHEYPYLDRSEKLEYPTETWAAQDLRKSDVFEYATRHADGEERARFLERSEFFFRSSTATLAAMPTRTLARPVVLMLVNGLLHAETQRDLGVLAPRPDAEPADFGRPELFIPQKARAKRRLVLLVTTAAALGVMAGIIGLVL
jgi:YetA-like protein